MLKGKGNSSFDEMMKRMWQGVSPWGPLEKGCLIEMQASAFWLLKNVGPTLTFYAYNLLFQINAEYLQLIIEKERNKLLILFKTILTRRKQAPIIAALTVTSRSAGTWIPKLSAFVKTSFTNPDQYFEIFPIVSFSLVVFTFKKKIRGVWRRKRWF